MKNITRKITRKKLPKKAPKKAKKPRKKRTTIKEAYENGYKQGYELGRNEVLTCTTELIDKAIDSYNADIEHYPRNTKFVELQLDAMMEFKSDLRERLIYNDSNTTSNEQSKKSSESQKI